MNPLEHTGTPVEDQIRGWSELAVQPYDKHSVDPYTATRVILMNGIEVESVIFSHQFARHTDDLDLKRALAMNRRIDAQQQKAVEGLNPGEQTPLETTIRYEQVAVDLTAWLARHEPNPGIKQALDFALLEDFDHLYRYSNLYELLSGGKAVDFTQHLTEISPGRPGHLHHRHPADTIRPHYDTTNVDPQTRLNVMTIVAAEQQTMNYYMNHSSDFIEPIARALYTEIGQVEQEHVTHYESLLDPIDSWIRMWVFHEYNEAYLYWSMLQQEGDARIARIWEEHLDMEIGQLQVACDFLRRYEGIDPEEILPPALPDTPLTFEPNKEYVRSILESQVDLRMDGLGYASEQDLPSDHRFFAFQQRVNAGGNPQEQVIDLNRERSGHEYRDETEGEHPVTDLRDTSRVTA
jgi:hypothetical protein